MQCVTREGPIRLRPVKTASEGVPDPSGMRQPYSSLLFNVLCPTALAVLGTGPTYAADARRALQVNAVVQASACVSSAPSSAWAPSAGCVQGRPLAVGIIQSDRAMADEPTLLRRSLNRATDHLAATELVWLVEY